MDAQIVLEVLAMDAGTTIEHIMELAKNPTLEQRERSRVHDWRNYVKPAEVMKMDENEAVAALIIAHRKANEEEWD